MIDIGGVMICGLTYNYTVYVTNKIIEINSVVIKSSMEEKSDVALLRAIKGMLPKNALGRAMAKKVKIYKGATHPHEAQHPTPIKVKGGRE